MINKIKNLRGFTLIETLVAVLLLATTIVGPLTIASKGLTTALISKDQITAFYLAQDGVEQVRFLRDSACLTAAISPCDATVWLSSLTVCTSTDGSATCYLDSLSNSPPSATTCGGIACPVMRYDPTNHTYNYDGSVGISSGQYLRTISIQNDPSGATPDEAVVTVTVSWTDIAGVVHMPVIARENIFRWE